jgi:hypothetical protein
MIYYIERLDHDHVILHEEEVEHRISRVDARMSIAWMKMNGRRWVRGIERKVYEEALAEMDKDEALFSHGK